MIDLDEDALELAFWHFLGECQRKGPGSDRPAFKAQMRKFARESIEKVLDGMQPAARALLIDEKYP